MSPIAVETSLSEVAINRGQYKELASGPKSYRKSVEEEEAAVKDSSVQPKTNLT